MDASTVKLKQGDIMIQRGTNHAWANRSDKRARCLRPGRCRAAGNRQSGGRRC
jgi:hypothetical protein